MAYVLGRKSRAELEGVHPRLVAVVEHAIKITAVDFSVHDGLRTLEEQREYFRRGVSKTMRSKHLVQSDGYGHAVDLVPWINGKLRWEWEPIYHIAAAVGHAAKEQGVELIWGGNWKQRMSEYVGNADDMEAARNRTGGWDGPHYQLD